MTEPESIPPPLSPSPFQPQAVRQPGGCGRPMLVGCGVAFLLLGIAAVVFLFQAKNLLAWTLGKMQSEIVGALPPDVTPEERQRLDSAFAAAAEAVRAGKLEQTALTKLQGKLMALGEKAPRRQITRQDVLDLTETLEAVAGKKPEPAPTGSVSGPGTRRRPARAVAA
jgi:hypothetical protein